MLADDSLLALQWDNCSFAAVTNILKNFQVVSNLAINESKSLIVPIGHNPRDRTPLDQTAGFPILQGALFEHLGVWFSTTRVKGRIEHMIPQWDSELNKIKAAIELRDNRHHTLLDRVLTVKSLLVSKLVYKFKSMDSPPTKWLNNLQSILIKYIWSRGPHHMTASKTFLPIEQGGLNMINVHWQEKSLKLAWFQKAQDNPELYWVQYLHSCLTIDFKTFIVSNIARKHLHLIVKPFTPPFWRKLLELWCDLHFTAEKGHVGLMPVAYNSALTDKPKPRVFCKSIIKALSQEGIHTIQDLIEAIDNLSAKCKHLFCRLNHGTHAISLVNSS